MCACVVVVFSVACASRKATRADAPAMATASVLQGSAAAGAQPLVAAAAAGACRCHDTQRSAETHQLSGATLTLAASAAAPAPAPAGTGWRRRWTACLALGLMIKFGLGTLVSIGSSQNQGHFRARRPARPDAVAAGSDSPFVRTPVPFSPRTRATAAAAAAGLAHNAVRTGDHHTNHARRRRQVCQLRLKRWCPVPVGVLPCRHHRQRALRHGVPGASKSSPARSVAERSVAASDSDSRSACTAASRTSPSLC